MTLDHEIQLYLNSYRGNAEYGKFIILNRYQYDTFYILVQVILSVSVVVTGYFV